MAALSPFLAFFLGGMFLGVILGYRAAMQDR